MPTRRIMPANLPEPNKHPDHHYTHWPIPGLRAARERMGWTIEELGEASGYGAAAIAGIEANPTELYPRMVSSRLSAHLGVTHDEVRGL